MWQVRNWFRTPRQRGMVFAVAGAVGIYSFMFAPVKCSGDSMRPTLEDGDILVVDKMSHAIFGGRKYSLDDIVVGTTKKNRKKLICKRILGLPGDTIVYPNLSSRGYACVTLDSDEVWLGGDNFLGSKDSKNYGPLSFERLQGKVVANLKLPPFKSILRRIIDLGLMFPSNTADEAQEEKNEKVDVPVVEENDEDDLESDEEFSEECLDELADLLLVDPLTCFNISHVSRQSPAEWLFLRKVLADRESTRAIPRRKRAMLRIMVDQALCYLGYDEVEEG